MKYGVGKITVGTKFSFLNGKKKKKTGIVFSLLPDTYCVVCMEDAEIISMLKTKNPRNIQHEELKKAIPNIADSITFLNE